MCAEYNRKDSFYEKAKREGYRSRAAYKLLELDKKYRILKKGTRVLDLGCAPGSWMQVAINKVGEKGRVVGIDLEFVEPVSHGQAEAIIIEGDITESENLAQVIEAADGKVDVLLSDISHKLTGIKLADTARSAELLEMSIECANRLLRPGGIFVSKVFPNNDTDLLVKNFKRNFKSFSREVLGSTRKTSKEFYVVGKGFKG